MYPIPLWSDFGGDHIMTPCRTKLNVSQARAIQSATAIVLNAPFQKNIKHKSSVFSPHVFHGAVEQLAQQDSLVICKP
jgi:hypothetical protein